MFQKIPHWLIAAALVVGLATIGSIFIAQQVIAGDDIVSELESKLEARQVPVRNVELTNIFPRQITVTLASTSSNSQVTLGDPLYSAIVQQEAALLKRKSAAIDYLQIVILNTKGEEVMRADLSADQALEPPSSIPSDAEDAALAESLRAQMQLGDMTLEQLEVTKTAEGHQSVKMNLTASNLEDVNRSLGPFMLAMKRTTNQMHDKGIPLASVSVDIFDPVRKPFVKYALTYLSSRASETWWMAPGVTQDWFPHPAPTSAP